MESCPREDIYDPKTFKHIPNPNVRYAYGSFCVKKCPGERNVSSVMEQTNGANRVVDNDGTEQGC